MKTPSTSERRRLLRCGAAAALAASGLVHAQAKRPIVLGHTYPASGIFADVMPAMKAAIDASLLAVNARGGVGGRPLQVVSLDDGYDPGRSLANAEKLRNEHGAIALVSPLGVPAIAALGPWAQRHGIALVGARSGADAQRGYQREVFFNVASFGDEARYLARHLSTLGTSHVAVAMVDNPAGRSIAERFAGAAAEHKLAISGSLAFAPDGSNAAAVAAKLLDGTPRTLLLAGGGKGAVALVRELVTRGWPAPLIYSLSTSLPQQFHDALGARSNGMVFAQVMPSLTDPRLALVSQYRQALEKLPGQPKPSSIGLEAWLSAQVAILGLSRIDGTPSAAALVDSLERLGRFDVGGFWLQYDATSHHGSRYVDLGILTGGRLLR